jgi:hypothetical protein
MLMFPFSGRSREFADRWCVSGHSTAGKISAEEYAGHHTRYEQPRPRLI